MNLILLILAEAEANDSHDGMMILGFLLILFIAIGLITKYMDKEKKDGED